MMLFYLHKHMTLEIRLSAKVESSYSVAMTLELRQFV